LLAAARALERLPGAGVLQRLLSAGVGGEGRGPHRHRHRLGRGRGGAALRRGLRPLPASPGAELGRRWPWHLQAGCWWVATPAAWTGRNTAMTSRLDYARVRAAAMGIR